MGLITQDEAMAHCKADSADASLVTLYAGAAEESVIEFLNRMVYPDQAALDAALTAVPTEDAAARQTYLDAVEAAAALEDVFDRERAVDAATIAWRAAKWRYMAIYQGMVVNQSIRAAILLRLGHLYRNREEMVDGRLELDPAIQTLLLPHRVGWGV